MSSWKRIVIILGALLLFLVGFQLIRTGVSSLSFALQRSLIQQKPVRTLGLGWLGSYLLLTGSPLATASLALLDSGELSEVQTFTMIAGISFGAIFVTLFFGLLYYLQGRQVRQSLSVGVLAYLTTFWISLGSLFLGLLLLNAMRLEFSLPIFPTRGINDVFEPFARSVALHLPRWAVMVNGFVWLMLSFRLADYALPDPAKQPVPGQRVIRLQHPLAMFVVGFGVTLLSQSVAITCGLLVPLYARGHIGAGRFVPYLMGANIATFSDTLLAAQWLGNAAAVHVVLTEIVSLSVVSLMILLVGFSKYQSVIERWTDYFTESAKRFCQFVGLTFLIPVLLIIFF